MAKKKDARSSTTIKSQPYTTTWLKNALRSMGVTATEYLRDVSPNLYEIGTNGTAISQSIINSLKKDKNGTNRIGDTIKGNKYVKIANDAFKNVIDDLKSGNLNNSERMERVLMGGDDGDDGGFSFDDDGAEDSGYDETESAQTEAILQLSDDVKNQTVTNVKIQKASNDAMISIASTQMQQFGQAMSGVSTQLTNIENNLSALLQYFNENVSRYIEGSMAYYEKTGSVLGTEKEAKYDDKVKARDVFNSAKGGINISRYKDYVKQNLKESIEKSNVGLFKSIVEDENNLKAFAANPVGLAMSHVTSYIVPKFISNALGGIDKALNAAIPDALSQIGDLANDTEAGLAGNIKRSIGKLFGLRVDMDKSIGNIQIERGAIQFDGETKHAITEIIPKELRMQTGYLHILTSKMAGKSGKGKNKKTLEEQVEDLQKFWSYEKNDYVKREDIDKEIAGQIVDAIKSAFSDTAFGSSLEEFTYSQDSEKKQKKAEFAVEELMVQIQQQGRHLRLPDILAFIDAGAGDDKIREALKKYVSDMAENDEYTFKTLNTARIDSRNAAKETREYIKENYRMNNLTNSSFRGNAQVDEVLAKVRGYNQIPENFVVPDQAQKPQSKFSKLIGGFGSGLETMWKGLLGGRGTDAIRDGMTTMGDAIGDVGKSIKEDSDKPGGILFQIKSSFKSIGTSVKDGFMLKFLGKKKNEQTGKYEDSDEKVGIFSKITDAFKKTFKQTADGWTDAIFGEDEENPEEARKKHRENVLAYLKDNLPNAITGTILGAGAGLMSGGILSMLVGGGFGGAILGAAGGFLAKNEKFQNFLFGEKDEDGNRLGGFISKRVQDYYKENKDSLIAGGVGGAAIGTFTGGGLLGTLVGGPIAGALLGVAGSVVAKSKWFDKFLHGDEENGQKGIFKAIADAFNRNKQTEGKNDKTGSSKLLAMAGLGTAGGALTGAMIAKLGVLGATVSPFGPIGGALTGLALAIKAQSGNFKEWMFGKKEGLDLGNGKKVRKQGVVGQFGNMLMANIVNPLKTEVTFIGKDFINTAKGKIFAPFALLSEYVAGGIGDLFHKVGDSVGKSATKLGNMWLKVTGKASELMSKTVGKFLTTGMNFAYGMFKKVISVPGTIVAATVKALNLRSKFKNWTPIKFLRSLGKDIRHVIIKGLKETIKGIFNVATAPFRFVGRKLKSGVKSVKDAVTNAKKKVSNRVQNNRLVQGIKNSRFGRSFAENYQAMRNRVKNLGDGTEDDNLFQRYNRRREQYKKDAAEIKKQKERDKIHDKNAKIIAKASKNQFSQDTDEARTWLKYHNPAAYRALSGDSLTKEKLDRENAEKIKENGRGTFGMGEDALKRARLSELNEEGRQTKILFDLRNVGESILNFLTGKKDKGQGYESTDDLNAREAREAQNRKKHKNWIDYKGYTVHETTGQIAKYDPEQDNMAEVKDLNTVPKEVVEYADKLRRAAEEAGKDTETPAALPMAKKSERRKKKLSDIADSVKKYFKEDFMSETKTAVSEIGEAKRKRKARKEQRKRNRFYRKHQMADQLAAMQQMYQSQEAQAAMEDAIHATQVMEEPVSGHSLGGLLKAGLSLVGEKGAELIFRDKLGKTEVLDTKNTEDVLEDAARKKKRRNKRNRKLRKWFNRIIHRNDEDEESEEEQQSDERREDNAIRARYMASQKGSLNEKDKGATEKTIATLLNVAEQRRDSQENALKKAQSVKDLKEKAEKEKLQKEQAEATKGILEESKKSNDTFGTFKNMWSKIFSHKGLLTAGIVAGLAFLKNKLPSVFNALTNITQNIIKGIGNFLGGAGTSLMEQLGFINEHATRTDGNTMDEQAQKIANDIKDGNIITDENGNATRHTDARLNFLTRTAMNFAHSNTVMPWASKATKRQKAIFRGVKKVGKGAKAIGTKIGQKASKLGKSAVKSGKKFAADVSSLDFEVARYGDEGYDFLDNKLTDRLKKGIVKVKNSKVGQTVGNAITKAKDLKNTGINALKNSKVGQKVSNAKDLGKTAITKGKDVVKSLGVKASEGLKKAATGEGLLSKVAGYIDNFLEFIKKKFAAKAGEKVAKGFTGDAFKNGILKALKSKWDDICQKIAAKLSAVLGIKGSAAAVSFGISEAIFATIGVINGASGTAKLFGVSSKEVDGKMILIAGIIGGLAGTTAGSVIDIILQVAGDITGIDFLKMLATAMYNVLVAGDEEKMNKLKNAQVAWEDKWNEERNETLRKQYDGQVAAGIIDGKEVTYEMFVEGVDNGTYEASYTSFADWNTKKNKSLGDHIGSGLGKMAKGTGKALKNAKNFIFGGKTGETYTDSKGNTYTKGKDNLWDVHDSSGKVVGSIAKNAIPEDAIKTEDYEKNIVAKTGGALANIGKTIGGIFGKKSDSKKVIEDAAANTEKSITTSSTTLLNAVTENARWMEKAVKKNGIKEFLFGRFKKKKKEEKQDAWYEPNGCYYVYENGFYTKYNINGDAIMEGIEASGIDQLKELGMLTKGEVIKKDESKTSVDDMVNKKNSIWTDIKNSIVNGWNAIKTEAQKNARTTTNSAVRNVTISDGPKNQTTTKDIRSMRKTGGGMGDAEEVNGSAYFSQNDSRWANKPYGVDKATISKAGCGPTAMAMVAKNAMGDNATPETFANMAVQTGDRDESGTNWNFINKAANAIGLNGMQKYNPTVLDLATQLDSGNQVLLSGVGDTASDPYTKAGHYVVAVGRDEKGNVLINDPRGKEYSKSYDINTVAKKAGSAWAFANKRKKKKGGYGITTSASRATTEFTSGKSKGGMKFTANDVISVARNEIGYIEKNSANNLEIKEGDVGDDNYTKYGRDMNKVFGHSNHDFWCATFVVWCFWKAANQDKASAKETLCDAITASCANNESAFRKANRWVNPGEIPQPGDVIFYTFSHTGIVVSCDGSKVYTIEGNTDGSNDYSRNGGCVYAKERSINDKTIKGYGRPKYDAASNFGGITAYPVSSSTTTTTTSSSGGNIFTMLTSGMSNIFSEFTKRVLSGDRNTDFSNVGFDTMTTTTEDGLSTSNYGGASAANITGSDNKEKIFKFLTANGFTPNAAAGAMGCWEAEASNNPDTLEGFYLPGVGREKVPSIIASNESLDNFTRNTLFPAYAKSGLSIDVNGYRASDGHYYPGLGLAQWTGERAKNLKQYADRNGKSWGALDTQLEFFMNAPGEFQSRTDLQEKLQSVESPEDGATAFLDGFEMSKEGWHTTAAGQTQNAKRRANARAIYDKYAGTTNSTSTGGFGEGGTMTVKSLSNTKPAIKETKELKTTPKMSVDYTSTQTVEHTNRLSRTAKASKTSRSMESNGITADVSEALTKITTLLTSIVDNTGASSEKLDALQYIRNLRNETQKTPAKSTPVSKQPTKRATVSNVPNTMQKKADLTARQIAMGGF